MSLKLKKYSVLIIAAVLLVAMAFAGAASAADTDIISAQGLADALNATSSGTGTATVEGNTVTLKKDAQLGGKFVIKCEVVLDLNGHTLTAKQDTRLFDIGNSDSSVSGTFTLNDTSGTKTGKLVGNGMVCDAFGGGVNVEMGTFTMNGGNITNCNIVFWYGGGVGVGHSGATFIMNGGTISDCHETLANPRGYGGGVYVAGGVFVMNGGNITGCSTLGWGGGVTVSDSGTFTLNGGNITGCNAAMEGGGVSIFNNAIFNMVRGNITGCNADYQCGGVMVGSPSKFTMTGGMIDGNTAPKFAGLEVCHPITIGGNAHIGGNDLGLRHIGYYPVNITISGDFSGSIANITLYNQSLKENPGDWVGKTIVNGSVDTTKFALSTSPVYNDYSLTISGNNLVLSTGSPVTTYPIYITNKTNTYQLTSATTKVYSDDGSGYANLTDADPTTGTYTLELCNFNASCSGKPIINASVANLTIKLTGGESNLTGSCLGSEKGLLLSSGNLTIKGTGTSSKLLVNNTNSSSNTVNSIYVKKEFMIDNAKVTAIANNGAKGASAITGLDKLTITGSNTVVEANATSITGKATSIGSSLDIIINSSAKVTANAQGGTMTASLCSESGNVSIESSAVVEANATSKNGDAYAMYAGEDVEITSAKKVTAKAETPGSDDAFGLYAGTGDITITGTPDVTIAVNASLAGTAHSIIAGSSNIKIADSTVKADAHGSDDTYALYSTGKTEITGDSSIDVNATSNSGTAFSIVAGTGDIIIDSAIMVKANAETSSNKMATALCSMQGNISISGSETVIDAKSTSPTKGALTIVAGNDLTINSLKRLTSIGITTSGTATSFAYNYSGLGGMGKLNIDGLATGYTFSNATSSGDEPNAFATFKDNWQLSDIGYWISNYTAVKIEKKSTPTPSSSSSSSRHTGYTQILQEVPTTTPTAAPTEKPATPTVIATEKPTTQATQASPAPFVGLLAGLGAAAVLLRLRK